MEAFKSSPTLASGGPPCPYSPSLQALQDWDLSMRLESYDIMFKPVLEKYGRNAKAALSHLLTVHNETCACQIDCASEMNKVWNQKKLSFIELNKQSGLTFDDFLGRILRLLLSTNLQTVEPLSESDFWLHLRHQQHQYHQQQLPISSVNTPNKTTPAIDDEELNDIQNFILNDIVKGNQTNHGSCASNTTSSSGSGSSSLGQNNLVCLPQSATNVPAVHAGQDLEPQQQDFFDELAKARRKEKHMAPIDCTGVSGRFEMTWFCEKCSTMHGSKYDCNFYKHFHSPKNVIHNTVNTTDGLPSELVLKENLGVYTAKYTSLKAFTRLGPLTGEILDESQIDFDEDRTNLWLLYREDGRRKCIIGQNWIRNVIPAESASEANCLVISINDRLFLVSSCDIGPDTCLRFFAKEDPTTEFWTSWTNAWANQRKCSRCSMHGKFSNVADYRVHIALWHDLSFQGNPQNRIYYCPDCNTKKIGAKDIVKHCKEAHNTLPFHCRHCSKRFETYNSLIKHKNRIHSADKPLRKTCDTCGKVYLDPKALKQHIKQVHERSEQLHCNRCERILSSKYALNRHVKEVHQRQQEHICYKCSKHFTQQSNLKQHMLIHFGVKPFACQHGHGCRSAFTTKQTLQVHYRKVHRYTDDTMPPVVKCVNLDDIFVREASSSTSMTVSSPSSSSRIMAGSSSNSSPSSSMMALNHHHHHPLSHHPNSTNKAHIMTAAATSTSTPMTSSGLDGSNSDSGSAHGF